MRLSGLKLHFLFLCPILFAVAASAENSDLVDASNTRLSLPSTTAGYRALPVFVSDGPLNYPRTLSNFWLQTAPPPPKPAKQPEEKIERATINPSMVGYIDDAIVHSEVRIRFDSALHNKTPDRAEFFYGKCGCYRGLTGGAYDGNSPGPGDQIPKYVNFQELYFLGEYAHGQHFSGFIQIPIRWIQATAAAGPVLTFPSSSGISDMALGLKAAPFIFENAYLTFQFKAFLPTGDARQGLGTNHASIEPSLLYFQRISSRLAVEAEIGDTHPLSSSAGVPTQTAPHGFAGDVFFYGAGPSYQFMSSDKLSVGGVLEVVGWNVGSGFVTTLAGPTTTGGVNIVNMKIGPRVGFHRHHSLYFGYGIALTSQNWYHDIFRTEYRYAF
jgi:hypothetical protein